MRKTFLAAAAALLFLLPVASAHAAPLGPYDPHERDEFRFRWGEGFSTRYDDYFSSPRPNRKAWQNQAYVYGEYSGYDWSVALRGGAATFSTSGMTEYDPFPFLGIAGKLLVWSDPTGTWSVGATATFDQAAPFDTGGSRPGRITGLVNASTGLGVQKRLDDRRIAYGGPVYSLGGFSVSPRYTVLDNNVPVRPSDSYYKVKNNVGLHGGMRWTLPGIDLQAEGGLTLGGLSAAVSFRLPLEGGPASLLPRSIRELFEGTSDRPREEKDGWREGPVRDDGPAEIPGEGEGER
jgi:hypothetical protein